VRGWLRRKVAVAISRTVDGYVVTPIAGKTLINDQILNARCKLKDGDILQVSSVVLEFRQKREG
jgi:hypothetical protein